MLIQFNRLFSVSCRSAILFIAIMYFFALSFYISSAVLGFYNYSTHFVLHLLYIILYIMYIYAEPSKEGFFHNGFHRL